MKELNVMICSHSRMNLLRNTINSILSKSPLFENINIYLFDHNTEYSVEYSDFIQGLISNKKIQFYNYLTDQSICNTFAKLYSHYMFYNIVKNNFYIRLHHLDTDTDGIERFYLICDNDMMVYNGWDNKFLNVYEQIKNDIFCILVPYPSAIQKKPINEELYVKSNQGGSSAFWFMSEKHFLGLELDFNDLTKTFNKTAGHDVFCWKKIQKIYGNYYEYCAGVISKDPIILHLGGFVGSICNKNYENEKDLNFKDKSVDQIYNEYSKSEGAYLW